jgi:hypothetical protein
VELPATLRQLRLGMAEVRLVLNNQATVHTAWRSKIAHDPPLLAVARMSHTTRQQYVQWNRHPWS